MKKHIFFALVSSFFLFGCGPKDPAFCDCLDATEKVNQNSEKILSGDFTENDLEKQVELRKQKETLCKPYETINAEQSSQLKEDCENR